MTLAATTMAQAIHRIEGLISMTKPETTMTTELRVISTPDITASNEVLKFERAGFPVGRVAAASWITARTPRFEALTVALEAVFRRIRIVLPEHMTWLLAGSSAWQPD